MPDKTTTANVPATPATSAIPGGGDHDRVVMASRRADGTPDQTPDFEYIGDRDTSIAATKEQLGQLAASAVDAARAGVAASPGDSSPDPAVQAVKDEQESAVKAAEKAAEAEVNARFTRPAGEQNAGSPGGERR